MAAFRLLLASAAAAAAVSARAGSALWPRHGHDARHSSANPLGGATTGSVRYTAPTDGYTLAASPVITNSGTVVIGTTGGGGGGVVVAFTNTSDLRWTFVLPPLARGTSSAGAIVGEDLVVVPTNNGTLYALNLSTGTLVWTYVHPYPMNMASPAVDDATGTIFVGCNLSLLALDRSGAKLWANDSYSKVTATPTLYQGLLVVGCTFSQDAHGALFVLNATTGYALAKWQLPGYSWVIGAAAVTEDRTAIVCGAGTNAAVYAFSLPALDTPLWSYSNFSTQDAIVASPAVYNGVVFIVSGNGRVAALTAATGAPLWTLDLPYTFGVPSCFASPALDGRGALFIACRNFVVSLRSSDGSVLWNHTAAGLVTTYSSPAVGDGVIVVGTRAGDVVTFE